MREQKPSNPIVITGDAHVHSVRNVPPNFESFDGTPVATEFMGTSISIDGDSAWPTITTIFGGDTENPHRLFQTNQRGYVTRRGDADELDRLARDRGRDEGARAGLHDRHVRGRGREGRRDPGKRMT